MVGDVEAIEEWLTTNDIPFDYINESPAQPDGSSAKLNAGAFIDDRASPFRGDWNETLDDLFKSGVLTKAFPTDCPNCGAKTKPYMNSQRKCRECDFVGDKSLAHQLPQAEIEEDEEEGDFDANPRM